MPRRTWPETCCDFGLPPAGLDRVHIKGPGLYGANAVYLDYAASGITVYGNVFYKAGRAAFIGGGLG